MDQTKQAGLVRLTYGQLAEWLCLPEGMKITGLRESWEYNDVVFLRVEGHESLPKALPGWPLTVVDMEFPTRHEARVIKS